MELLHPRFIKWEPGCTELASCESVRYKGPGRRQPGSRLSSTPLTYCVTSGKLLNLSVPLLLYLQMEIKILIIPISTGYGLHWWLRQ